jgi:hypothetical protein
MSSFARWLHVNDPDNASRTQLAKLCLEIDMETPTGRDLKSSKESLCTLNSAGSGFLRKAAGEKFCTFLGGQCAEERIIVVGDPQQLPATMIGPACKNAGYGYTWLGQVYKLFPTNVHLLSSSIACIRQF